MLQSFDARIVRNPFFDLTESFLVATNVKLFCAKPIHIRFTYFGRKYKAHTDSHVYIAPHSCSISNEWNEVKNSQRFHLYTLKCYHFSCVPLRLYIFIFLVVSQSCSAFFTLFFIIFLRLLSFSLFPYFIMLLDTKYLILPQKLSVLTKIHSP